MIQRQGEMSIQMLENVQQKTLEPIIKPTNLLLNPQYWDMSC